MSVSISQILVLRGGAIGDFVLTLPVFAALRARYPEARIEIVGYPRIAELALAGGWADALRPIEAPALASFFSPQAPLDASWAAYFSGASLIVSYLHDPEGVFAANVRRCTPAPYIQGPHRPQEGCGRHATEVLLDPLRAIGIAPGDGVPRLAVEPWPMPAPAVWLAAHPGSGSERKNWPESRWRQLLVAWLRLTPCHLVIIGGEAEGERTRRLREACRAAGIASDRVRTLENASLIEVARHLKACAWFLGHDSGITHLAAALGVPGLALWGETDAVVWRPRSDRLGLLREPGGLAAIEPTSVLARLLDLRAASLPGASPTGSLVVSPADILVIGYGNSLRSDDGVGPCLAEAVRQWSIQGVVAQSAHQLTPEMAATLHSAKAVVFIDARLDRDSTEVRCVPLDGPEGAHIQPHLTTPEGLLHLARSLYGRAPAAWLITIPVTDLAFGDRLSPEAQIRADKAKELLLRHLALV